MLCILNLGLPFSFYILNVESEAITLAFFMFSLKCMNRLYVKVIIVANSQCPTFSDSVEIFIVFFAVVVVVEPHLRRRILWGLGSSGFPSIQTEMQS